MDPSVLRPVFELPNAASAKRHLGEASISFEAAEHPCAHRAADVCDNCVHDVMATGDLELADAGTF